MAEKKVLKNRFCYTLYSAIILCLQRSFYFLEGTKCDDYKNLSSKTHQRNENIRVTGLIGHLGTS